MAILCKEAAKSLVENNSNLEIIGPLFRNTDVIVKKSEQIEKIAIQQSKLFHEEYLQAEYPQAQIFQTNRTALSYAYESNQVDAILVDLAKSGSLDGLREYPELGDTFVLVAVRGYREQAEFKRFVRIYNKAVDILNEDTMERNRQIERYTDLKEADKEGWKVEILKITEQKES